MHVSIFFTFACCVSSVFAHLRVWGVWVNGKFQGDGRNIYIRSPETNDPVKDLHSKDMICNTNNSAVPQSVAVKSGNKFTFEWYHENRHDDIITDTHKGAIQVYIAPALSDLEGQSVWTKLDTQTYDTNLKEWATILLKKTKGQHSVTVPDIPTGDYLLRAEVIALHQAKYIYPENHDKGAEFYMSCVQVHVENDSPSQKLLGGTAFPGTYQYDSPGVVWDLYGTRDKPEAYIAPGPKVWEGSKGGEIEKVGNP
ncbi:glycoside hydrolase family 61 protein [Marasmius fiardii PR-910]|nr:glycoside hydrolase family 61 protein [Marasmius fiardii PR-910]